LIFSKSSKKRERLEKPKRTLDDYEFISKLGEGAEGEVWSVRDRAKKNFEVLKKFKYRVEETNAVNELTFLSKFGHENIMSVNSMFMTEEGH
jgi:serine/threonine protein kinase